MAVSDSADEPSSVDLLLLRRLFGVIWPARRLGVRLSFEFLGDMALGSGADRD